LADLSSSIYNAKVIMWGGLGSENTDRYWKPLHEMQKRIPGAQLIKSGTGYAHWDSVAAHINETNQRKVLIGHSNGVYAITKIAEAIGNRTCRIIALDKTLKGCPRIGANVDRVCEIWFGLSRLKFTADFTGDYKFYDFKKESHVGGLSNPEVQDIVVNLANGWK